MARSSRRVVTEAGAPPSNRVRGDLSVTKMPHELTLDGIRATAISIVLLAHVGLEWIIPGGFGVTLFFFLSGYLITSLLRVEVANSGRVNISAFYLRRVLRIIPPLWITMMVHLLFVGMGWIRTPMTWLGSAVDIGFLNNYADWIAPGAGGFFGIPLWSLAVEEHFYLFFPFILGWALPRFGARRLALGCAIICAVVLLIRIFNVYALNFVEPNYTMTHTRIDSILFGSILALWQNPLLEAGKAWRPKLIWVAVALAIMLVTLFVRDPGFRQTLRYTLQGISLFVLLSWVLGGRVPVLSAILASPLAQRIGAYSYTIYLVHRIFLLAYFGDMPTRLQIVPAIAIIALSVAYAAIMFHLIERPLASVRQRLNNRNEAAILSGAVSATR